MNLNLTQETKIGNFLYPIRLMLAVALPVVLFTITAVVVLVAVFGP